MEVPDNIIYSTDCLSASLGISEYAANISTPWAVISGYNI